MFRHRNGQWAKKILGRLHYFGTDADGALAKWLENKDSLLAGHGWRHTGKELTLKLLCNKFLTSKKALLDAGELSPRTWRDYFDCCETLLKTFGKECAVIDLTADHFEKLRASLAKRRGPVALGNEIQRVRTVFKYAFDQDLIARPVRFGGTFQKPSRKTMRRARQAGGDKMIEAAELRRIVNAATQPLKAMILLGLNCGFGQTDVANLPIAAVDLAGGWIDFPRPKTAMPRRCALWPETVAALKETIADRPDAKDEGDAGLVFITKYGHRWVRTRDRDEGGAVAVDAVGLEFTKLLEALELKRAGLGFYGLRHVFRTIADESKDQPAIDHVMGHVSENMAARYRERIGDNRLRAVADVVRAWLWPAKKGKRAPATIPFAPAAG